MKEADVVIRIKSVLGAIERERERLDSDDKKKIDRELEVTYNNLKATYNTADYIVKRY